MHGVAQLAERLHDGTGDEPGQDGAKHQQSGQGQDDLAQGGVAALRDTAVELGGLVLGEGVDGGQFAPQAGDLRRAELAGVLGRLVELAVLAIVDVLVAHHLPFGQLVRQALHLVLRAQILGPDHRQAGGHLAFLNGDLPRQPGNLGGRALVDHQQHVGAHGVDLRFHLHQRVGDGEGMGVEIGRHARHGQHGARRHSGHDHGQQQNGGEAGCQAGDDSSPS